MNYQKIYNQLIEKKLKSIKTNEFLVESHHIVPRSFGGKNNKDNLVFLSLREHFVAHLLLYKINQSDTVKAGKMAAALRRMSQSKKYRITSRQYATIRGFWMKNHPCQQYIVKTKIKNTLRLTRLKLGWHIILCACGCGEEVGLGQQADKKKYINGHKPLSRCKCGCGNIVTSTHNNNYIKGHIKKIKCACGCGKDTYKNFNIDKPQTKIYCATHKPTSKTVGKTLSNSLKNMSQHDMAKRIKNSLGKTDPIKRSNAIKKGKGSKYKIFLPSGGTIEFWSYDNVWSITGYTYNHIKYRLKQYNGELENGSKIICLKKYKGNNKLCHM